MSPRTMTSRSLGSMSPRTMTSRLCLSYGEPLPSAARVLGIPKGKLGTRAAEFEALPQLGLTKAAEDGKKSGDEAKARVAEVGGLMSATCLWHP